jgi:RNA polymerase sigma-70 factor (ECF subfamily)
MNDLNHNYYEKLFREHYEALCRFGLGMIGDPDQAEDIVQQAFIKLWNKRMEMDLSRSVKAYLYASVRNSCINHIRDNKKFRSRVLDIEIYGDENAPVIADGFQTLVAGELSNKIEAAFEKLPEKSKAVFMMSRLDRMKYREIAEKLGITEKTVEAHMSKALKILRIELKDYLILWFLLVYGL